MKNLREKVLKTSKKAKFKKHFAVADFETTQLIDGNPHVYLWAIWTSWENQIYHGTNIYDFFKVVFSFEKTCEIYFHNGGKFDLHFFKPVLSEEPFYPRFSKYKKIIAKNHEYDWEIEKSGDLNPFEYSILCDKNKKIIELKIGSHRSYRGGRGGKIKKNRKYIFKDSCQIFPGSLKKYGEMIGVKKIEFDGYKKINDIFYSWKRFKKEVKDWKKHFQYLIRDIEILRDFLLKMNKIFNIKFWKSTTASTAFHFFLSQFPENFYVLGQKFNLPVGKIEKSDGHILYTFKKSSFKSQTRFFGMKVLEKILPLKWMNKIEKGQFIFDRILKFYKGGLTQTNPSYQGLLIQKSVSYLDINSSYPFQMLNSKIPVGEPVKNGDYQLLKITAKTNIENRYGIPFLPVRKKIPDGEFTKMDYPRKIEKNTTFWITTPEWDRVKKFYDGKWKVKKIYEFKTILGSEIFAPYVNYFWKMKEKFERKKNEIGRFWAKIMLNSLYGKFGEKNHIIGHLLYEGNWFQTDFIKNVGKYLPISSAITAEARMKLVDSVGKNYEKFLYCDTDSLMLFSDFLSDFPLKISDKLGDWKKEFETKKVLIRARKQYALESDKKTKLTFAGLRQTEHEFGFMPREKEKIYISAYDLVIGKMVDKQIAPEHLEKGIFLKEIEKEIKPIWSSEYSLSDDCWWKLKKMPKETKKEFAERMEKNYWKKLPQQIKFINHKLKSL